MTDKRNCIQCNDEYEPKYYAKLGTHILVGAGNCPSCVQTLIDELEAKEEKEEKEEK